MRAFNLKVLSSVGMDANVHTTIDIKSQSDLTMIFTNWALYYSITVILEMHANPNTRN